VPGFEHFCTCSKVWCLPKNGFARLERVLFEIARKQLLHLLYAGLRLSTTVKNSANQGHRSMMPLLTADKNGSRRIADRSCEYCNASHLLKRSTQGDMPLSAAERFTMEFICVRLAVIIRRCLVCRSRVMATLVTRPARCRRDGIQYIGLSIDDALRHRTPRCCSRDLR